MMKRASHEGGRSLERYNEMRDFQLTSEPRGEVRTTGVKALAFVVQKHDARRLHYDFRLELDGVMLSWAVPKGPSLRPSDKRLAVQVEDHPIDYRNFEGVIPEGQYGGGPVIVWDRGTWKPVGEPHEALQKGHLDFELSGDKLHGRFVLVRTGGRDAKKPSWLLIKRNDEHATRNGASSVVEARPDDRIQGPRRSVRGTMEADPASPEHSRRKEPPCAGR